MLHRFLPREIEKLTVQRSKSSANNPDFPFVVKQRLTRNVQEYV